MRGKKEKKKRGCAMRGKKEKKKKERMCDEGKDR